MASLSWEWVQQTSGQLCRGIHNFPSKHGIISSGKKQLWTKLLNKPFLMLNVGAASGTSNVAFFKKKKILQYIFIFQFHTKLLELSLVLLFTHNVVNTKVNVTSPI